MASPGELLELRAADLRFTDDEAATYLNDAMDLTLDRTEVEALETRTEGWIAALQLAAISLQGRDDVAQFIAGFAGDDRFVLDYLVDEVLGHQAPAVQRFLLQTSILSRLSGPLCDAVTASPGGRATLEALERANLFLIPLDDRRSWYRYHHLFAEVLQARLLDEEPDAVAELHRRASDWYEEHGDRAEAIRHALAGQDVPRAATLIELAVPTMRQSRQDATLRSWFEALPPEVYAYRPVLAVGLVGARMVTGDLAGVAALLDEVEQRLSAVDGGAPSPVVADEAEQARLPTQIAMYRAALALFAGDTDATITHARRALDTVADQDHLGQGAAAALLGLAHWTVGDLGLAEQRYAESVRCFEAADHHADVLGCRRALADIQLARGHLDSAMRTLEAGLERSRAHAPVRGTADMHVGLGELLLERNDLAAARSHVDASAELDDRLALPQNAYRWRVALARLVEIDGDPRGALELLEEAEERYDTDYSPSVRPVAAVAARVQVRQGDLGSARRWAAGRGPRIDDEPVYVREYEHLSLARLLVAEHVADGAGRSLDDAIGLLDRLFVAAEEGEREGSAVEVLALQALARRARGDVPFALATLDDALRRAEPEGFVRVFLDEGASMAELLRLAAASGSAPARRLLDAGPAGPRPAAPRSTRPALVEELSGRELDVLRLLKTDLSGPEIARELMVSLNTVRTHTKNIYLKLGVNSRRSAVRRAAELGL